MGLAEKLGCEGCKRRKEKLKKIIAEARAKILGSPRARKGRKK